MTQRRKNTEPLRRPALLRRADQAVVAALVAAALVLMAAWWLVRGGPSGRVIELEHAKPTEVRFTVDINQAEWPELAQLPNIGETLARRIVATREAEGPYATAEDLLRVPGIGPKTLDDLLPYLRPIAEDGALVEHCDVSSEAVP